MKRWNGMPREGAGSPGIPGGIESRVDVALGGTRGSAGNVGLGGIRGILQPQQFQGFGLNARKPLLDTRATTDGGNCPLAPLPLSPSRGVPGPGIVTTSGLSCALTFPGSEFLGLFSRPFRGRPAWEETEPELERGEKSRIEDSRGQFPQGSSGVLLWSWGFPGLAWNC